MTEFSDWAASILKNSGLPDNDSTRFALASLVMHAPAGAAFRPKYFFIMSLRKHAANQIADATMRLLKAEDDRRRAEAELAAKEASVKAASLSTDSAAVTASSPVPADAKPVQN